MANELYILIGALIGALVAALSPYFRKKNSKKDPLDQSFAYRYAFSALAAFLAAFFITNALALTDPLVSLILAVLLGMGGKDLIDELLKWATQLGLLPDTS